jgi:hypothetical protein
MVRVVVFVDARPAAIAEILVARDTARTVRACRLAAANCGATVAAGAAVGRVSRLVDAKVVAARLARFAGKAAGTLIAAGRATWGRCARGATSVAVINVGLEIDALPAAIGLSLGASDRAAVVLRHLAHADFSHAIA